MALPLPAPEGTFEIERTAELGSGGYGKVLNAIKLATGERVAAKLIPLNRMKRSAVEKEVKLMALLSGSPYVVGLQGIAEDPRHYIIYMDLAEHGELFSRVISSGSLQEHEAQPWFAQLLLGVQHMHAHGVVHRDLKLENVLLDGKDVCKICDFGLAHLYDTVNGKVQVTALREVCGSKSYCAPEVLAQDRGGGYEGFPADVWSCGICLFAMLAGFFPLDEVREPWLKCDPTVLWRGLPCGNPPRVPIRSLLDAMTKLPGFGFPFTTFGTIHAGSLSDGLILSVRPIELTA